MGSYQMMMKWANAGEWEKMQIVVRLAQAIRSIVEHKPRCEMRFSRRLNGSVPSHLVSEQVP